MCSVRVMTSLVSLWLCFGAAQAATYYVDFGAGSDALSGTTLAAAWKHCPGDAAATGNANRILAAGDTVLFKGGALYRGAITVNASGVSGRPIVFKGDGWGADKAVIDGSDPLTGWTKCAATADCGNNSHWSHLYTATVPANTLALTSNLYQDDSLLSLAQYPNPPDPFFMDDLNTYLSIAPANVTTTTIVDPRLANWGATGLVNAYVYFWRSANDVDFRKISAYNAAGTRITFAQIGADPYTDRNTLYALANAINDSIFERAGEYYLDEGARKVYLWPLGDQDPNTSTITISTRGTVLNIGARTNVTIEGLVIRRCIGSAVRASGSAANSAIVFRNNEVIDCRSDAIANVINAGANGILFENNYFTRNARLRGLDIYGDYIQMKGNRMVRIGRTTLSITGAHGVIAHNYVYNCRGVHSNAITTYGGTDILIEGNQTYKSNVGLTFQDCADIRVINNVFHGDNAAWPVACWNASNSSNVTINHNLLIGSGANRQGFYWQGGTITNLVMKNNVIDGLPAITGDVTHNLFTTYAVGQTVPVEPNSKVQSDLKKIFVDPVNYNFHLLAAGPAVDAGTNVGVAEDLEGNSRPAGPAVDMGPYEYLPDGIGKQGFGDRTMQGLRLYANPAAGSVRGWSDGKTRLLFCDLRGNGRRTVSVGPDGRFILHVPGLPSGVYLLMAANQPAGQRVMLVK